MFIFVNISKVVGCIDHLQNDLNCVGRCVRLYSLTHSSHYDLLVQKTNTGNYGCVFVSQRWTTTVGVPGPRSSPQDFNPCSGRGDCCCRRSDRRVDSVDNSQRICRLHSPHYCSSSQHGARQRQVLLLCHAYAVV